MWSAYGGDVEEEVDMEPHPNSRQPTKERGENNVVTKPGYVSYTGYYMLLFFVYWFGAYRFDYDNDEDFDPEDVQLYLQDKGILRKNLKRSAKNRKKRSGKEPSESKTKPEEEDEWYIEGDDGLVDGEPFDEVDNNKINVGDIMEPKVEGGERVQDRIRNQWFPFFTLLNTLAASGLWVVWSIDITMNSGSEFASNKAGLDDFSPGWSDLRLSGPECQDYRHQAWRSVTYQWTHIGVWHVLVNGLTNLLLGVPLEGLHGGLRMLFMYNVGVFGGACCYWAGDAHKSVVGMSGGCYALLGMHLSDLLMHWRRKKFRTPTLVLLISVVVLDVFCYIFSLGPRNVSHTVHLGGFA